MKRPYSEETTAMSINVGDLAYCRRQVPDLARAQQFLTDFGLRHVATVAGLIYFRATDASAYCYVIEEGPAKFLGFAFHARARADLDLLAQVHGKSVEAINAPGGGWRVRLKEPNGYDVDVVFGVAASPAIEITRQPTNTASEPLRRVGELYRLKRGEITPVKRLAHIVLGTPRVRETTAWFHSTLGMLSSDEVIAGPDKTAVGAFIRINSGEEYVDHHTIFVIRGVTPGLHHISFECQDLDAVLADHHLLKSLGRYEHVWGIGRHLLGSQVFDYWEDPFGYPHEHWADSDRVNASAVTKVWEAREGMITQWGEEAPERFRSGGRP
jgi:catechol 2,3-dioxygenase-like lactoylglutathione lyase family enzyme